MTRKLHLLLDMNYLCWRAFHTTRSLSHGGNMTGVVYGVFREILTLQQDHGTSDMVFCWDHGAKGKRKDVFPGYKQKRYAKPLSKDEELAIRGLRKQMEELKTELLPYLGYTNVFYQDGYEGDDLIASCLQTLPKEDGAVIVSADKDLLQLLRPNVFVWNPTHRKVTTVESFREEWKIRPSRWPIVKALAGCATDEIPGIKGVGEKTAAKFMAGDLDEKHRLYFTIIDFTKTEDYKRNFDLVKLPFPGTMKVVPEDQEVSVKNWKRLCDKLGMKSLRDTPPGQTRGFGLLPNRIRRA